MNTIELELGDYVYDPKTFNMTPLNMVPFITGFPLESKFPTIYVNFDTIAFNLSVSYLTAIRTFDL